MNRPIEVSAAAMLITGFREFTGRGKCAIWPGTKPDRTDGFPQDQQIEKQDNGIYLYRVKVVQRDLDAVNYLHRSGSTNIAFKGTTLLPWRRARPR